MTLSVWWLLSTDPGRQWLLRRASTAADSGGWQLEIQDFALRVRSGRLTLHGVRLGLPDAPPLLVLDHAEAAFTWRGLLRQPRVLEQVMLRGVVVDVTAPLPQGEQEGADSASDIPVAVHRFELRDVQVLGGPADGWLETWSVLDLALTGSVSDGGFEAAVEKGVLRLARRNADDLDLDLSGRARGPFSGPYTIQDVGIRGSGLDVGGSGTAGLRPSDPLVADFHLHADAASLLGNALPSISAPSTDARTKSASGVLRGQGTFDLRRRRGELELRLRDVPAELFEPLVGRAGIDRIAARGTHLDGHVEASLSLREDVAQGERVEGHAALTWRADTEPLVDLQIRNVADEAGSDLVRLACDVSLLPGLPGSRSMEAALSIQRPAGLETFRSERTIVEVEIPEMAEFESALQGRWPAIIETLPPLPWLGQLNIRTELTGTVTDPHIDGSGLWRPNEDSSIRFRFDGRPVSRQLRSEIAADRFELASLAAIHPNDAPGVEGRVDGELELELSDETGPSLALRSRLKVEDLSVVSAPETTDVDLEARTVVLEGRASLPWAGDPDQTVPRVEDLQVDGRLVIGRLGKPAGPWLEDFDAEFSLADAVLQLRRATGTIQAEGRETAVVAPFELDGQADFTRNQAVTRALLDGFQLRVAVDSPHPTVERLVLDTRLENGALALDLLELDLPPGGPSVETLTAHLPLSALEQLPGLDTVGGLPLAQKASGPLRVAFEIPALDTGGVAQWLGNAPPSETLRTSLHGGLEIRPEDPTASTGEIFIGDATVQLAEHTFRSAERQTVSLTDRRLRLRRGLWQTGNRELDVEAEVKLEPGWRLDQPILEMVSEFSAVATGSLEAELLNGYLAGGRAQGLAEVTVLAAGTPEDHAAEIEVVGDDDMSFTWVSPYATRVVSPRVRLKVEDGVISLMEANARLNEGRLDVEGTILDEDRKTHLSGFLDSIRYRLDYGLTVLLSGNFDLQLYPDRPGDLGANILVERGFLRRPIDPDREVLNLLLQPPELDIGDATESTRDLRLDLDIATVEGVRIKNNVADLHASWAPLEVGGTLDGPYVRGSVEVDPGGKVYAWGQVVRLDRAVLEFSGRSDVPARLDLTTTSSLEDPSIATSGDRRLIAERAEPVPFGSTAAEDRRIDSQAIASGLTTYYGDQLASRLGSSLSGPRIEYRPLRIFGESSPEAKLVVSQDLSPNVSLSAAFGLREAEDRTYLLDFHELAFLPRMSATAFTTEEIDYGLTLQQMIRLGGAEDLNDENLPRLDDIEIRCAACTEQDGEAIVAERRIRRAVGFLPGDLVPDGSDFDIEVDVEESLRRSGFPDPKVRADIEPDKDPGYVDLVLDVDLGPRAVIEFTGEQPPRSRRDSIRSLYRADYYEQASLQEMREQAVRVWKSLGHPEPQVNVERPPLASGHSDSDRRVIVHSEPGRQLDLRELEFRVAEGVEPDLPESVIRTLHHRFESPLWRVKLAAADEDADARLLSVLSAEGYPNAEVASRKLTDRDRLLSLRLSPGPRRVVSSLTIEGLETEDLERRVETRSPSTELFSGNAYSSTRVAEEAARLEADLRSWGYYEAKVHSEIDAGANHVTDVRLVAEPGNRYVLREVELRGAGHVRESWIRNLTGLESGALLDRFKVAEARRRLIETRLFSRVTVDAQHGAEGTKLVFDLVEKPRFEVAYGGRWESEGGFGGIFEALDNNFTGRGVDLGLRVLYGENEERARFYSRIPRLTDRGLELELFADVFEETEDRLESEGWEVTGQLRLRLRPQLEGRLYGRFVDQELTDRSAAVAVSERERTPSLGIQLILDSRDRILDPQRGTLLSLDLSGAREIISEQDEYLRFYGQLNHFTPLSRFSPKRSSSSWVWSQSLRVGLSDTATVLPRSVRFFAGGPFSVRGYSDRDLGPREANEDGSLRARGGQALLVLNQELRFPLPWEGVQGVAFADAGNVWDEVEDLSLDDLFASLGLGLRAQTPIGIVRLDLGFPLDGRPQDDDFEVYLGFGHAF